MVVIGLLATIPALAVAAVAKFFVDDVLVRGRTDRAWPLVGVLAALTLLQIGLQVGAACACSIRLGKPADRRRVRPLRPARLAPA